MTCPVVEAFAQILGGDDSSEGGGNSSPGVVIGSGEDAVTYHSGNASFIANAMVIELARAKIKDAPPYRGDLLRFIGGSKHFALCFLLSAAPPILADNIARLNKVYEEGIAVDICTLYPNVLAAAINRAIDSMGVLGVKYLTPLDIDKSVFSGCFPAEASQSSLESIASDILKIGKVADKICEYHLTAAKKIDEILRA